MLGHELVEMHARAGLLNRISKTAALNSTASRQ